MAVDYDQILYDLQAALIANVSALQNVFVEGSSVEIENLSNMPLANIRIASENIQTQYIDDGYSSAISILVDIMCVDLANFEDAQSLRSDLTIFVKNYLIANPSFSNNVLSSQISSIYFSAPSMGEGLLLAMATISMACSAYAE